MVMYSAQCFSCHSTVMCRINVRKTIPTTVLSDLQMVQSSSLLLGSAQYYLITLCQTKLDLNESIAVNVRFVELKAQTTLQSRMEQYTLPQ
jgi:hypothetical protein